MTNWHDSTLNNSFLTETDNINIAIWFDKCNMTYKLIVYRIISSVGFLWTGTNSFGFSQKENLKRENIHFLLCNLYVT